VSSESFPAWSKAVACVVDEEHICIRFYFKLMKNVSVETSFGKQRMGIIWFSKFKGAATSFENVGHLGGPLTSKTHENMG
jgi:hypothetical protein